MLRSITARIAQALGLILAVMCLNFLLIHITPGDPATVIVGESGAGDPELLEEIRAQYGLDRPVIVQLLFLRRSGLPPAISATRTSSTSR